VKDSESTYRQFVQFEERAAAIYLQLASRFVQDSQVSSFWLEMAMQEKQHAGLLQFCVYERMFAPKLPDDDEIAKLNAFFEGIERRAADSNLTLRQAFSLAIEMEASEINTIYCNLTTALHNSTYLLRRKIATSLPNHIDELIAAARKFGVNEDELGHLNGVKNNCSDKWQSPE
jgi:rubrerythrin